MSIRVHVVGDLARMSDAAMGNCSPDIMARMTAVIELMTDRALLPCGIHCDTAAKCANHFPGSLLRTVVTFTSWLIHLSPHVVGERQSI